MSASREARLTDYAALIRKWNPAINLVSPASVDQLEERHIADSAQLARLQPNPQGRWLDIGSGGGLPGLVVAIYHPDLPVSLVDSDRRKVAFLQAAIRQLGLKNCIATAARVEQLPAADASNLSARALAPLDQLMPYLERHLAQDGTAWLMKGRNWQTELSAARMNWRFDVESHPSSTDPEAAILQIRNIRHG
ncbi:MAG TPA: 16S rRNA (guanine(527)-N(7))-methyltransferase RsmG [Paracoccus sp.]|nr:16S rRNA (guanine(527)-N(7))-methyltransferase RsmG [Paracoccus sp. (in: a-proteobacteria)]